MQSKLFGVMLAASLLCSGASAGDAPVVFIPVVEGGVRAQGNGDSLTVFTVPVLRDGRVAFRAHGTASDGNYQQGIYVAQETVQVVADLNTPIPAGHGLFTSFGDPTFDGQHVAFVGHGSGNFNGLYSTDENGLTEVARIGTPTPGVSAAFTTFWSPSFSAGVLAFVGAGENVWGVYTATDGVLDVVAQTGDPAPGSASPFREFYGVTLDDGDLAFEARNMDIQPGIYNRIGGTLGLVADVQTETPGGGGPFTGFGSPGFSDGHTVFKGNGPDGSGYDCVCTDLGGSLRAVADDNTPVPGGVGNFDGFTPGYTAISGEIIAFHGLWDDGFGQRDGIYMEVAGSLYRVVDDGMSLDGQQIWHVQMGREGLDGKKVAVLVSYPGPSEALYVAAVCEPLPVAGDVDGNGVLEAQDAAGLTAVLLDPLGATADQLCAANANLDERVDGRDIAAFVSLLVGG